MLLPCSVDLWRELNVVSERLFIQPMLWGNWLHMLWAGVPANRVCLAV